MVIRSTPVSDPIEGDFDSKFEHSVFQIVSQFTSDYRLTLDKQHPVLLKPKTKNQGRIHWKVDFRIRSSFLELQDTADTFHDYSNELLVEAKGGSTWEFKRGVSAREFKRTIRMLDYLNPSAYSRVLLVFQDKGNVSIAKRAFPSVKCCTPNTLRSELLGILINDYSKLS